MLRLVAVSLVCSGFVCCLTAEVRASGEIPTMEDAGYAFEASERCDDIALASETTRRLRRSSRFKDGRRTFKMAADRWGADWACKAAFENLGPVVDLSDYYSGRRVVQPPPEEIPPNPALKSDHLGSLAQTVVE